MGDAPDVNRIKVTYLDVAKASRLLHLPDDVACLYLMPIGYAAEDPKAIERKTLDEIVFDNRWAIRGAILNA